MVREEIGLQPHSKVILHHAQQDFDTISSEVFLLSIFSNVRKNLCYQGNDFLKFLEDLWKCWEIVGNLWKTSEKAERGFSEVIVFIMFLYIRKSSKMLENHTKISRHFSRQPSSILKIFEELGAKTA